jgi:hypothetical protein
MIMHAEKARRSGWSAVARITSRLLLALGIFLGGYLLIYRPQQLRWGATDAEIARAMPGDQIQLQPIFNATRAITIGARPEQIWPWLVQMGYKRAGFYGYDALDNAGIPSADRIIPALQHLKVGDTFPIWEGVNYRVVEIDPNHSLVIESSDHSTMALGLYPLDASHTRLVWRIHNAPYNWASPYVSIQLFTDAVDFVAVRQNMLGIKTRAEGVAPMPQAILNTEAVLWTVMFLAFLIAEIGLVVRRDWLRPLLAVSATGLLMVGLVLLRPPVWVDGLVTVGVCVGLWKTYWPNVRMGRRDERRSSKDEKERS